MLKKWMVSFLLAFSLATGVAFAADKINLNTATAEQLEMLDGVGPSTAANIIEYREANGGFQSIDEVVNVRGIGDKKAAQLAEQVTVSN
ncbi:MAG: helix-hairpin-helix domain-containing protein [Methylophaga sp.]|nr:helix-hairpin-helix domain-containing protein [Methylophaga sp.]